MTSHRYTYLGREVTNYGQLILYYTVDGRAPAARGTNSTSRVHTISQLTSKTKPLPGSIKLYYKKPSITVTTVMTGALSVCIALGKNSRATAATTAWWRHSPQNRAATSQAICVHLFTSARHPKSTASCVHQLVCTDK